MNIMEILRLLEQEYGSRPLRPDQEPVSILVMTILSQNTSDANSHRAFNSLLATFDNWEEVAAASVDDIALAIRSGGLAQVKARRIKQALCEIKSKRGSLDLAFLADLPLAEAKSWLRELPGVGPKTAGCVLLFSLGRPALPVDTHVFRVAKRLGLVDSRSSPERAHELLESLIPAQNVYQFHLHMVEHGRKICQAQRPHCQDCGFNQLCQHFLHSRQGGTPK